MKPITSQANSNQARQAAKLEAFRTATRAALEAQKDFQQFVHDYTEAYLKAVDGVKLDGLAMQQLSETKLKTREQARAVTAELEKLDACFSPRETKGRGERVKQVMKNLTYKPLAKATDAATALQAGFHTLESVKDKAAEVLTPSQLTVLHMKQKGGLNTGEVVFGLVVHAMTTKAVEIYDKHVKAVKNFADITAELSQDATFKDYLKGGKAASVA